MRASSVIAADTAAATGVAFRLAAAATDAKRRPGFQTESPRRLLTTLFDRRSFAEPQDRSDYRLFRVSFQSTSSPAHSLSGDQFRRRHRRHRGREVSQVY